MKYVDKLVMVYSYFSHGDVEETVMDIFFRRNVDSFDEMEFNRDLNKLIIPLKKELKDKVEGRTPNNRQIEEALLLCHKYLREEKHRDIEKHGIITQLIKNIYCPTWQNEEINKFNLANEILQFEHDYFFSYTEKPSTLLSTNTSFLSHFPALSGYSTKYKPDEKNILAQFIKEKLSLFIKTGKDIQSSSRTYSCANSLFFVQLVHSELIDDDDCYNDHQIAKESIKPLFYRYILKPGSPLPKRSRPDWHRHISDPDNQFRLSHLTSIDNLGKEIEDRAKEFETNGERVKNVPFIHRFVIEDAYSSNILEYSTDCKTILFASATPPTLDHLRTSIEFLNMLHARTEGRQSKADNYYILSVFDAKFEDFRTKVLHAAPNIVHFSGHGFSEGGLNGLYFQNGAGSSTPISNATIAEFFASLWKNKVECILLNACFSQSTARAIQTMIESLREEKGIDSQIPLPILIGISNAIRDDLAIKYSQAFYQAFFNGFDFKQAHEQGVIAIQDEANDQDLIELF